MCGVLWVEAVFVLWMEDVLILGMLGVLVLWVFIVCTQEPGEDVLVLVH